MAPASALRVLPFLALALVAACGSTSRAPVGYRLVVSGATMAPSNPSAFKDQQVSFTVTTDVDEQVHLNGYDIRFDCRAGIPVTRSFTADRTGTFVIGIDATGTHLGDLSVSP